MDEENSRNKKPQRYYRTRKNRNRESEFDPNRFYWCYGMGDVPEGMELVASSKKRITCEGTMNEQAKGQLRSDIRSLGGNAAMGLSIERSGTVRRTFVAGYHPATITTSAYAALILPKKIDKEEKKKRENRFLTLNGLLPSSSQKESSQKEERKLATVDTLVWIAIIALVFTFVWLFVRLFEQFS